MKLPCILFAAFTLFCGHTSFCGSAIASESPNVLLILADDLGWSGPLLWQLDLYPKLQRHYPKPKPYATEVANKLGFHHLANAGRWGLFTEQKRCKLHLPHLTLGIFSRKHLFNIWFSPFAVQSRKQRPNNPFTISFREKHDHS
jgi:hypothetical protein